MSIRFHGPPTSKGKIQAHSPCCGRPDNPGAGSRLGSNSEACLRPSYMLQCFALYAAAVNQSQPERMAEMMAYQTIIAKASQRYQWPSWAIYDNTLQQEMAGTTGQSWAWVDPSIYFLCFTGQVVWDMSNTRPHTPDMPGQASKEALEHGIWRPAGTGSVLEG